MKKYATAFAFIVTTLSFASMSLADNIGKQAEGDVLHGHGAVPASQGQPYDQSEARSGQVGTDSMSYPQDFKSGSPSSPAVAGADAHQDHDDTLHIINQH